MEPHGYELLHACGSTSASMSADELVGEDHLAVIAVSPPEPPWSADPVRACPASCPRIVETTCLIKKFRGSSDPSQRA